MADNSLGNKTGNPVVLPTIQYLGTLTSIVASAGMGTVSSVVVDYDQQGRFLIAAGRLTLGTTTAGNATVDLPFGLITPTLGAARFVGSWWKSITTGATRKRGSLWVSNTSSTVQFGNDDYTTALYPDGNIPGTTLGASGDIIYFEFRVPTTAYALTAFTAYGAGQASLLKDGLVSRTGGNLPGKIDGVATSAGYIGQVLESQVSAYTGTAASGVYADATTLTLTAGTWEVTACLQLARNGANFTSTNFVFGLTPQVGNSSSGLNSGVTCADVGGVEPTGFSSTTLHSPALIVYSNGTDLTVNASTFAGTQVIRAKAFVSVFTTGAPQYKCSLRAKRIG